MNLLYILNLEKVIPAPQRAQLRGPAFFCPRRHLVRHGPWQRASCFCELGVALMAVAVVDHPAGALSQHAIQFAFANAHPSLAAGSAGNVAEDLVDQLFYP